MYMIYIWLAIIILGLVIELIVGSLYSVWVSLGALIPFCMSFWGTNNLWYIAAQVIIFGTVTVLTMIYLRKVVKRYIDRKSNK